MTRAGKGGEGGKEPAKTPILTRGHKRGSLKKCLGKDNRVNTGNQGRVNEKYVEM